MLGDNDCRGPEGLRIFAWVALCEVAILLVGEGVWLLFCFLVFEEGEGVTVY